MIYVDANIDMIDTDINLMYRKSKSYKLFR